MNKNEYLIILSTCIFGSFLLLPVMYVETYRLYDALHGTLIYSLFILLNIALTILTIAINIEAIQDYIKRTSRK